MRGNGDLDRRVDELEQRVTQAEQTADIYRKALWRIADADSGTWGRIAFEALRQAEAALARDGR